MASSRPIFFLSFLLFISLVVLGYNLNNQSFIFPSLPPQPAAVITALTPVINLSLANSLPLVANGSCSLGGLTTCCNKAENYPQTCPGFNQPSAGSAYAVDNNQNTL